MTGRRFREELCELLCKTCTRGSSTQKSAMTNISNTALNTCTIDTMSTLLRSSSFASVYQCNVVLDNKTKASVTNILAGIAATAGNKSGSATPSSVRSGYVLMKKKPDSNV